MSNNQSKKYEFKADMKQMLHLIIHSLYTNPEIFIRELISNASDALNKIRFMRLTNSDILQDTNALSIKIKIDKEKGTFIIEDNGIGMTEYDLINKLGTLASSGTSDFLEQFKKTPNADLGELIGHFGVGFYSVFMVADEVSVITKSYEKDAKGYKWISHGEDDFTIEECEKISNGTEISFTFKEEYKQFSEDYVLKNAINKFSNFVDFPIYINDNEIERVSAIWQKKKADITDDELNEFYKFISNDFHNPSEHLVLSIEGNINFKSLLFIPATAPNPMFRDSDEKSLQLYVNRVFIQDDAKELLPDYLRFIKGVIDTDDLPLNVSREFTQSSPAIQKIKNILTGKILNWLDDISVKDKTKYLSIYKNFGSILKTGINSDFINKAKIQELLRFETTKTNADEFISLKEYTLKMKSDQKDIYYLFGNARELMINNPNLEYFKQNNIEVLLLTDPIDIFTIPYIAEYDGKKLVSIDKADIPINDIPTNNEAHADNSIINTFKEILGDKVADVIESKRLISSPVTLVLGKDGMDAQMEKMMQIMNKDFQTSKRILEINLSHPLIKNIDRLSKENKKDEKVINAVEQLFDAALIIEGQMKNPNEFVKRMIEFMTEATDK